MRAGFALTRSRIRVRGAARSALATASSIPALAPR
jgi:hypothetical protein